MMATLAAVEFIWIVITYIVISELRERLRTYREAAEGRRKNVDTLLRSATALRDEVANITRAKDDLHDECNDFADRIALIRHASDLSFPLS
jgi:predicted  nucleic acid-binding Zn-ribbon protein